MCLLLPQTNASLSQNCQPHGRIVLPGSDLEDAVDKLAENAILRSVTKIQRQYRGHQVR